MARYNMPLGMRYSTLEERKEFYTSEFNLNKVAEWFKRSYGKTKFAVIMGRHTQIYLEKYSERRLYNHNYR